MLTDDEISRAASYVEELRLFVHGLDVPGNNRVRAAGSCFAIAQEHHHAIVRLIEWRLFAAALSLVRVEFEAYVRGEWLSQCASDGLVEAFIQGKEPPRMDCLLEQLEMLDSFNEKVLSQIKQKTWKSMCAYTHTGGLHVQRWNTEDGIEANYAKEEIVEVLNFAEIIASLAAVAVAGLAADEKLAVRILEAFKRQVQA
ncbi:hypothetical protein LLG90_25755 [Aromatoleum toluclasticum]|uniref:DUF6988 family protein n=1 Tax=Aromatoleum toluclasticum TaxID=92003 RepID=UPI001D17FD76|nr:hypothetical protein [Aromatoleum toluclasticum]MCC4118764.1 hypothetical protein [Aromatoleum toluclasticum]